MTEIANINFQILVKMHNGDVGRAKAAWDQICQLGRYGNVPPTYEGGLDVKGLKIALEEKEERKADVRTYAPGHGGVPNQFSPTLADDIKKIEDLAVGDKPRR
jgi:hypothetical protein